MSESEEFTPEGAENFTAPTTGEASPAVERAIDEIQTGTEGDLARYSKLSGKIDEARKLGERRYARNLSKSQQRAHERIQEKSEELKRLKSEG